MYLSVKSIRTIFVEFCCAVTWDNVKSHSDLHLWSSSDSSNILYYLLFWSHFDFLPLLWSSYLLICLVPFLFAPALLFFSTPSCSHLQMISCNPVPSCSCIMCWLEPHIALTLSLLFSDIFFCSDPYFPNLLYLSLYLVWYKPIWLLCSIVYLLFICVLLCYLHSTNSLSFWNFPPISPSLTSVWLRSPMTIPKL